MPLDIAVGIVLSLGVAQWYAVEPTPFLVVLGILAALAPDLDILPLFWRTSYDHRSYPHYPAVQAAMTAIIYVLFGPIYGALYWLGVLAHLIHDTIGLGWGVAWLWPLSRRKIIFFPVARMRTYGWFMSFMPEEELTLSRDYHNPHWLRHYYLRPNPVAYIEYGALLIALFILAYTVIW